MPHTPAPIVVIVSGLQGDAAPWVSELYRVALDIRALLVVAILLGLTFGMITAFRAAWGR